MIKEKDMIEIEFTAKTKDENIVFDTTNETKAKENDLFEKNKKYGPVNIILGENQLLKGLEKDIIGKELNKDYVVEISAEDGFGKKSAKLIQLVPTKVFLKQNINPVPGLQVNIDNSIGIIKTVGGGRTLVDFNHPLSSKDVIYEYKITKIITDTKEKAEKYIKNVMGLPVETEFLDGKLTLKINFPLNDEIKQKITEKIKETIKEVKEVLFLEKKSESNKEEINKKEKIDEKKSLNSENSSSKKENR
jgi:peptidylprolyl isomerase